MSEEFKRKVSSRKFWALVTGVAVSTMAFFHAGTDTVANVVALIGAIGSCVGYMLAEAYVDGNRKSN